MKKLIVSLSNGSQWSGVMSLLFVQQKIDNVYPEYKDITVSVYEIVVNSEDNFSLSLISLRDENGWKTIEP